MATRYWLHPLVDGAVPIPTAALPYLRGRGPDVGGAGGDVGVFRVAENAPEAPAGYTDLTAAEFVAYSATAPWIAHTQTPAWTESEKGVLVPEPAGTAALVQAASATWSVTGGWEVCERLVLATETAIGGNTYAAGVYRLVRYTGARPAALSSYAVLYAAGVAEAVALAEGV